MHAHSGFSGSVDRNGLGNGAGNGASSGLRSEFPGLPANLRPRWLQHRLQLYIAASVQCVGLGPRGAMLDQSVFCTSDKKAGRRDALSLTCPENRMNCRPRPQRPSSATCAHSSLPARDHQGRRHCRQPASWPDAALQWQAAPDRCEGDLPCNEEPPAPLLRNCINRTPNALVGGKPPVGRLLAASRSNALRKCKPRARGQQRSDANVGRTMYNIWSRRALASGSYFRSSNRVFACDDANSSQSNRDREDRHGPRGRR